MNKNQYFSLFMAKVKQEPIFATKVVGIGHVSVKMKNRQGLA
jgi:hypothetical protein